MLPELLLRKRLTHAFVQNVRAPVSGATTYWDNDTPGFGLRVYSAGGKSFFLNYWLEGRERRHTIGSFPAWSVVAARQEAKELRQRGSIAVRILPAKSASGVR